MNNLKIATAQFEHKNWKEQAVTGTGKRAGPNDTAILLAMSMYRNRE